MRTLILVFGILLLGAGVYWLWGPTDENNEIQNQEAVTEVDQAETMETDNEMVSTETQKITTAADLERMFTRGENVICDYTVDVDTMTQAGKVYYDVQSDAYRITNTSQIDGNTYATDIIMQDKTLYTWGTSLMGNMAYKMQLPEGSGPMEMLESNLEASAASEEAAAIDSSVVYECAVAEIDPSLFALPADIEFVNMNDMIPVDSL